MLLNNLDTIDLHDVLLILAYEVGQIDLGRKTFRPVDEDDILRSFRCGRKPSDYQACHPSHAFLWGQIYPGLFSGGGHFRRTGTEQGNGVSIFCSGLTT